MTKVSPMMVLPPLLFAALAALFFFGMQRDNPDELPTALAGQTAPEVALTVLGDKTLFTDEDLRDGKIKLVNFWASWCAPCRVEHPHLEALAAEGVPIYGVNYKDKAANALRFLENLGDPYVAVGADREGRMGIEWGSYGVPETFLIDGDGVVVLRIAGPVTQRELDSRLRPVMEKLQGG